MNTCEKTGGGQVRSSIPSALLSHFRDRNERVSFAFWRTTRVTCIVLIADDDSGILDPGPRVQAKPSSSDVPPSMIPDVRIICIFGNLNYGDHDG